MFVQLESYNAYISMIRAVFFAGKKGLNRDSNTDLCNAGVMLLYITTSAQMA